MELKSHATLTGKLRILLTITIYVSAIAVLAGFYDLYSYSSLPADFNVDEVMLPSDYVSIVVGLVQFILAIITGITFLCWIYRSNKNLQALSGEQMMFSPGWSVGWYFIPVANLWKPYQVMKEIWDVSHKYASNDHALIGWWWTLWIISSLLGRLAFRMIMDAEGVTGLIASIITYIFVDGFDLVLAIVALAMVNRISAAYTKNFEQGDEPIPTGPLAMHL
jgi:hypothetical protein